jgi:tol-pal system protein YbgF
MTGWTRAAAAATLLALPLSPAAAASKTDDILKGVEDLQQQVLLLTKEQARSAEAIAEIRKRLQEQQGAQQSVQADLLQQVNALLDEIQILRQRLEDTGFRLANLTQEMRRLQAAPSTAPPSGAQAPGGSSAPPPGPGGGAASGAAASDPAAGARSDTDPQAAFQAAYADYSKGNFELAMWGFQDFLRRHRDHPLAGEAQYWIGECHFAQRDFRQAVAELDRLIQDFPDSPKVPVAHLKKGLAYLESNQVAQAVVQLQHLVQAYPQSDEARVARERLTGLGIR